jgi:hypothetical protein
MAVPTVLEQYALTTVEAVQAAGSGIDAEDGGFDDAIRGEINAVSRRVLNEQCEFKMPLSQKTAFDGAMTSGSPILTSAGGSFQAGDVGKLIVVYGGAGALGPTGMLETTILSYQSATQVTLAANALSTVSGVQYVYGSATRTFELTADGFGNALVDFGPYFAQAVGAVTIDTQGGAAGTLLDPTAIDYQPLSVAEYQGLYTGIEVYSWFGVRYSTTLPWNARRLVTVNAVWGWPLVPSDVETAVIGQVIDNLNASYRIITNSPIPGDTPEPGTVRRWGLNAQLRNTLGYYKRMTVVG